MTWQEVVRITHIDEWTCIRWRDDFRKLVVGQSMADKLDHLISSYYIGELQAEITLRQLPFSLERLHGGNDPRLNEALFQKFMIDSLLSITTPQRARILEAHYGKGKLWDEIAHDEKLNQRTLTRYREDFKRLYNAVIAQDIPVRLADYFNGQLDVYIEIAKVQFEFKQATDDSRFKQLEHQKATFKELLHDLPPIQLKALTMQDRDKRTQKDIALTLGVEYRTVVNWKEKFNRQLRKRLWQTN